MYRNDLPLQNADLMSQPSSPNSGEVAVRAEVTAGPRAGAAIEVRGLEHFYGTGDARKQVLYDNHLVVHPGEIIIMTGQSGSGKTTLLTLIGTLRRVQQGQLWVLGQSLHDATASQIGQLRKRLGFIFQAHNLFSSLNAMQNVRMALEVQSQRSSRRQQNKQCREILEAVGLGDRMHYKPSRLSGGQKQRVAVARGLVHQPDILLADEPTAALDEESGRSVVSLFQQQARQRGTAIVIVTHDNRILDVADRIVKMDFGHIARDMRLDEAAMLGEVLSRCSVFDGVAISTLTALAERMKKETYNAGTRVIQQGDPGDRFYVIHQGELKVSRAGQSSPLARLSPGQFFGETALITGEPRNADVDAATDVVLYSLDAKSFQEAMEARLTLDQEVRSTIFSG